MDTPGSDPQFADHPADQPLRVGILIFPEVEVLDFAGPFEAFAVAGRVAEAEGVGPSMVVETVAARPELIHARNALAVTPHRAFETAPVWDILIVPGGIIDQPMKDAATLAYIRAANGRARVTASVCNGAVLMAELGLFDGLSATTHWMDIDTLREYPSVNVIEDVPYVDQGAIISSAGISAGIGMSLHLVRRIYGERIARMTARRMQYDWAG